MLLRVAFPVALVLLSGTLLLHGQDRAFRPVTEAMLRNPPPGDWLNWRRTDSAWGYSPLDQITRQNVGQLQLAWSWSMDDTAIVHSGIDTTAFGSPRPDRPWSGRLLYAGRRARRGCDAHARRVPLPPWRRDDTQPAWSRPTTRIGATSEARSRPSRFFSGHRR